MPIFDRDILGEDLTDRVSERLDTKSLTRVSMPDGGEVFRGKAAQGALKAVRARAMTVDHSIIVADDFNPSRPEDLALYAHESHHLEESGGKGGHTLRDAEEIAARAKEAMVFHMAAEGQGAEALHVNATDAQAMIGEAGDQRGGGANTGGMSAGDTDSDAMARGYQALIAQGYTHDDVVAELGEGVMSKMDEGRDLRLERHRDKKGWT